MRKLIFIIILSIILSFCKEETPISIGDTDLNVKIKINKDIIYVSDNNYYLRNKEEQIFKLLIQMK